MDAEQMDAEQMDAEQMDAEQMDAEQRQAYLSLEREINRICDLNEKRLAEFYRMRARRLGNARPAGASADA